MRLFTTLFQDTLAFLFASVGLALGGYGAHRLLQWSGLLADLPQEDVVLYTLLAGLSAGCILASLFAVGVYWLFQRLSKH